MDIVSYCEKINNDCNLSEDHIYELCKMFTSKWSDYSKDELMSSTNKDNYITDIENVFSLFYLHFGSKEILLEIEKCLKEDPEGTEDVEEYIQFVEDLKNIQNIRNYDLNENSTIHNNIQNCLHYLDNKNKEMEDLKNTMKKLNSKLVDLTKNLVQCAESSNVKVKK